MIKPAQLYKDDLNRISMKTWYDMKYMYYNSSPAQYLHNLEDSTESTHSFVSVDDEDNILGYISYSVDWEAMSADNFGIISYDIGNVQFAKDVVTCIHKLFYEYNFNRVSFFCYLDNPAINGYRKLIRRFGGREIGPFRQSSKLLDGKLHDHACSEILKEELKSTNFKH